MPCQRIDKRFLPFRLSAAYGCEYGVQLWAPDKPYRTDVIKLRLKLSIGTASMPGYIRQAMIE